MGKDAHSNARARRTFGGGVPIQILPIAALPEFRRGHDLALKIVECMNAEGMRFKDGDVVVVAQKIVSKVEGRTATLSSVKVSQQARELAAKLKKDARLVEVILKESRRIVRSEPVLIVETHHGFVCANAGVDHSNVPGSDVVTLLPRDPDDSARRLAAALRKQSGRRVAVIISDTFGRPWRLGLTNVAIGAAGVPVLLDLRGKRDRNGKPLRATVLAVTDELAAAAGLVMGKAEGVPVVVIRGYRYRVAMESATRMIRPAEEDLFR
jgi:coenzyme F420-0:L-glutamate ligase / coenzyme F420-1:gamma-L-glutamate ligase